MCVVAALSASNLDKSCLQCLCHAASSCNLTIHASGGHAGPFWISRVYWVDAGNHTLDTDDPLRDQGIFLFSSTTGYIPVPIFASEESLSFSAYHDYAKKYACAAIVVTKYMQRYGKVCC